ncbi:hypothetical protein MGN70_005899 [Eutypa lata]|nr:hypothetical protein MGN70_005899 [Eutypa lata]
MVLYHTEYTATSTAAMYAITKHMRTGHGRGAICHPRTTDLEALKDPYHAAAFPGRRRPPTSVDMARDLKR